MNEIRDSGPTDGSATFGGPKDSGSAGFAGAKPPGQRPLVVVIFGLLSAIGPLSIDIYLPALPAIRTSFGADQAGALLTLSSFFVGFGLGQLFWGPLSDRFGRRWPLLAGLVLYFLASIVCTLGSTIEAMIFWRLVQALGGSAVPVLVQAMVRDLYDRDHGARILSLMMLVMGAAPIGAPLLGGQILIWLDWRWIFGVLAIFGAVSLGAAFLLPETLARSARRKTRAVAMIVGYIELFGSRRYLGYMFCGAFFYAALFSFIAGSPFVYIDYFRVPPEFFGFLFGANIVGMMTTSFINARLVVGRGSDALLRLGCGVAAGAGVVLAVTGSTGIGGIYGIAIPVFAILSMMGFVGGNATSGALSIYPGRAGAAAALSGAMQLVMGAVMGAIVGWAADGTPGPMSLIIFAVAVLSLLFNLTLVGVRREVN